MAEKSLDEQFAEIVAHWEEEAPGADPFRDGAPAGPDPEGAGARAPGAPQPGAPKPGAPQPGASAAAGEDPGAELPSPQDPPAQGDGPAGHGPARRASTAPVSPPDAPVPGWRSEEPAEVEEHCEPPPLQPLPSGDDKHFWGIIMGLVGGPLLLLFLVLFDRGGSGWWKLFALVLSITGFVLLVLRQPTHGDDDDDGIRL